MKSARLLTVLFLVVLVSCGGDDSSTSEDTTSKLTTRAFVSNAFNGLVGSGTLELIDYRNDTNTFLRLTCCDSGAREIVLSPDRLHSAVINGTSGIAIVDNKAESVLNGVTLSNWTESIAYGTDNKTVYAAVRNSTAASSAPGAIEYFDSTASTFTLSYIPVPLVRRIVISRNGQRMLAFSDQSNSVTVVDLTQNKVIATVSGFDTPYSAVFASDDSRAYVLNCGPECGGTTSGVSVLDMTALTAGPIVPASGATVALLDSSNLYVAGNGSQGPTLTAFTVSGSTLTPSGTGIRIGDGLHTTMVLGPTNKLFIGARSCTAGCLSIVDTSSKTAVIDSPKGDVTGMDVVPNRNIVYVAEGSELRIYDTTTNAESTTARIDIVGQAFDVKIIDK